MSVILLPHTVQPHYADNTRNIPAYGVVAVNTEKSLCRMTGVKCCKEAVW